MKIPMPPVQYRVDDQRNLRFQLEQADAQNHKRNRDVEIGAARLILTSPDGSRWALAVSNLGVLTAVAL